MARSIAIATGRPYREVYDALAEGNANERRSKRSRGKRGRTAREGIHTTRKWFKDYMASLGWEWVPTMHVGVGCKVHLVANELPRGRLIVSVSRHYTAVIDHVIHDTHNPQRTRITVDANTGRVIRVSERCVYGYWRAKAR